MNPTLARIVETLKSHPTMPIDATIDHTGGGVFCVRVDVDRTSDVEAHDGPFMYLTDGAEFGHPDTVAIGLYQTWEDSGAWPDGGIRTAAWDDLHATVMEGAAVLSDDAELADMAKGEAVEDLSDALDAFKQATADLDRVWSSGAFSGDEVANYPAGLPSFDEFAASVALMEVRT